MSVIHVETILPGPYDEKEILRYAMLPGTGTAPEGLPLEQCLRMAGEDGPVCRALWREYPVSFCDGMVDLGFVQTASASLQRHIRGCSGIILFALTAGVEMDRLIRKAQTISPVHGLLMHAVGAERAEAACDRLCRTLGERMPDRELTARFSPGYGDLPLSLQKDVFRALDCERRLGLVLTDELLMLPGKSVTAVIGLRKREAQ